MQIVKRINNNRLVFGSGALGTLALLSWLAFGYFGIHTAFLDDVVDEDGPVFSGTPTGTDETTAAPASTTDRIGSAPSSGDVEPNPTIADDMTAAAPAQETSGAPEIVTIYDGDFTSLNRYSVTGDALVLTDGTEQRFVRFENFESTNGPDLKVYLRADNGDAVSLGTLSGNIGNQNYEIPADIDLDIFTTVQIWCERFSVGFGEARLISNV